MPAADLEAHAADLAEHSSNLGEFSRTLRVTPLTKTRQR